MFPKNRVAITLVPLALLSLTSCARISHKRSDLNKINQFKSTQFPTPCFTDDESPIGFLGSASGMCHLWGEIEKTARLVSGPEIRTKDNTSPLAHLSGLIVGFNAGPKLNKNSRYQDHIKNFVHEGGVLIVMSQADGKDYDFLPRAEEFRIIGWKNQRLDRSGTSFITARHPLFKGFQGKEIALNMDGYFTQWPADGRVLARRKDTGHPVLIEYFFGKGSVIVGGWYLDDGYVLGRTTRDERVLAKNLHAHLSNPKRRRGFFKTPNPQEPRRDETPAPPSGSVYEISGTASVDQSVYSPTDTVRFTAVVRSEAPDGVRVSGRFIYYGVEKEIPPFDLGASPATWETTFPAAKGGTASIYFARENGHVVWTESAFVKPRSSFLALSTDKESYRPGEMVELTATVLVPGNFFLTGNHLRQTSRLHLDGIEPFKRLDRLPEVMPSTHTLIIGVFRPDDGGPEIVFPIAIKVVGENVAIEGLSVTPKELKAGEPCTISCRVKANPPIKDLKMTYFAGKDSDVSTNFLSKKIKRVTPEGVDVVVSTMVPIGLEGESVISMRLDAVRGTSEYNLAESKLKCVVIPTTKK